MVKKSKKTGLKKTKKSIGKGSKLTCNECGLIMEVVDVCDCADPCGVTCCGEPMTLTC